MYICVPVIASIVMDICSATCWIYGDTIPFITDFMFNIRDLIISHLVSLNSDCIYIATGMQNRAVPSPVILRYLVVSVISRVIG